MDNSLFNFELLINKIFNGKLSKMVSDLHGGKDGVLILLYEKDYLYASDIAKIKNISKARLSCLIKSLLLKGYIKVECERHDKRKFRIYLTDNGKSYIENKKNRYAEVLEKIYKNITEDDIENINSIIKKSDEII